jgi:hypothetical protein
MNFTSLPFGDDAVLWGAVAAMVILPAATVVLFRAARWI